jgi:hypothetical protein
MKKLIYLVAIMLFFAQCSKDNNNVEYIISGAAVKGKVVNATVTVYEYDGSGSRGNNLQKPLPTRRENLVLPLTSRSCRSSCYRRSIY